MPISNVFALFKYLSSKLHPSHQLHHKSSKSIALLLTFMSICVSVNRVIAQSDPLPLPPEPEITTGFSTQSADQLPTDSTVVNGAAAEAASVVKNKLVYKDATLIADDEFNTTALDLPSLSLDAAGRACSSSPTKLAWFYKPPGSTSLSTVMNHFDIFTLTKNDEKTMRTVQNAGIRPVLQYIKYDAIHDPCFQAKKAKGTPCSCSKSPLNNQVAWNASDICNIRDNHPDWFLRDASGNLLYKDNQVMMDPGNQGWREFWLSRMRQSQSVGWDGILIDNIATTFGLHGVNFVSLKKYSTDSAYQNAVVGFLAYARSSFFKPNGKLMYANISVRWKTDDAYRRYMEQLDGAQDEFWAYPRTGYYSTLSWEDDFFRARATLERGDSIILISQGAKTDTKRQLFAFGSYLLVASSKTYFRYTSDSGGYGQMWLYDNYQFKLGSPKGAAYRSGDSWKRSFTNGEVKVTPGARTAKITLYSASGC
jgi:hypothetical protein